MVNCIFYVLFFTLFLSASFGSLRFSQINRSFMSIYKGMFEASVMTVNSSGEPTKPYFNTRLLENYVNEYFEKTVKRYSTDYEVSFQFYIDHSNVAEIPESISRDVKITLSAKINFLFNYNKEQEFSIKSKDELWMKDWLTL